MPDGLSEIALSVSPERIQWAKDEIRGWASATEQEFCVSADESDALYAELDAVLQVIDDLAANQRTCPYCRAPKDWHEYTSPTTCVVVSPALGKVVTRGD